MKPASKINIALLLVIPACIAIAVFCFYAKSDIQLLAHNKYIIVPFTDQENKGNSKSIIQENNHTLDVQCLLQKGSESPYAGIEIHRTDDAFIDLEAYTLHLHIHSSTDFKLVVRADQVIPDYTDLTNASTFLLLTKTLDIKKGANIISLQTSDINTIPDWWYLLNPLKTNGINSFHYQQTKHLWLYCDNNLQINRPVRFTIQEANLSWNYETLLYILIGCLLSYYLIVWLIYTYKKGRVIYKYKSVSIDKVNRVAPPELVAILEYIGTHYANPELQITTISKQLGISQEIISKQLKKYCNKNFKQYLNQLRMEEAQRLLKESELQIAEIAQLVGYSNSQHFNRVFKEYAGETPTNYRELKL